MAAWPLCLALLLPLHTGSTGSARIRVEGDRVRMQLRCQALSLFEVLPNLDANGDGLLTSGELDSGSDGVAAYLSSQLVLAGADGPLSVVESTLELAAPDPRSLFPEPQQVDFAATYAAGRELELLALESRLFHDTSPDHRDFIQVEWNGADPESVVLDRGRPRARFPVPTRGSPVDSGGPGGPSKRAATRGFVHFLRLGVLHILTGWDHLLFLLGLLLAARDLRSLLWVVTAFTLAHSASLVVATFEWIRVSSTLVEIAIALSIAYVGADNLLFPQPRAKSLEAFGFGLIHGLGFAGFLAESLLAEPTKLGALLAFNLGVELGQVAAVLATLALLLPAARIRRRSDLAAEEVGSEGQRALLPRTWRRAGSTLVLVAGLAWFVERAWL